MASELNRSPEIGQQPSDSDSVYKSDSDSDSEPGQLSG